MVQSLYRNSNGGNVMLKIDMTKAYDRVGWSFLCLVLKGFGLSEYFCGLVEACVTSPWFSIMMNGI